MISVPSISMTSHPVSVLPAMTSHGNPVAVPSISCHTCARAFARALAIRSSMTAPPARSSPRRTVGPLGASPSTGERCPSTAISLMLVAPSAIAAATDTSTIPRLKSGDFPVFCSAAPSQAVSPAWSAAFRSRIAPACPTRPAPSPVTFRAWSHGVCCMAKSAPIWKLRVWLPRNLPEPGRSSPAESASRSRRAQPRRQAPAPIRCAITAPATRHEATKHQLTRVLKPAEA